VTAPDETMTTVVSDDPHEAWLNIEERGWGDGLPCIAPLPELVRAMLGERDPSESVAELPPTGSRATNMLVAVNAVMAGCDPAMFPVVVAAIQAAADPLFNLLAVQSTTNPATEVVVVNGPIRAELGLESGASCMGGGARANLTVGRAVRLVMMNVGGARPGEGDLATHGFPGKIGFCFAEAEEASPWPPLHTRAGLLPRASAVTVVAGSGTLNLLDVTADPRELLDSFSRALAFPASNDVIYGGMPLVVLSPEHARILAEGGFNKTEVQRYLFQNGTIPAQEVSGATRTNLLEPFRVSHYGTIDDDTRLHVADRAEDILIVVAGGPGAHSVYVPTFGDSRAVTRPVIG
jgi:hypothetical protein